MARNYSQVYPGHAEDVESRTSPCCRAPALPIALQAIEKNGLKIVEAYVDQIIDIRKKNVFQSCLPIRLARLPPTLPIKYLYDGSRADDYFECQLLKTFDFVLDVEAGSSYSDHVDVVYSYRTTPFSHSQYVHKSGAAFVQIIGGNEGFRWLKNRLIQGEKGGLAQAKEKEYLPDVAEKVRERLEEFCSDAEKLKLFYDNVLKNLPTTPTSAASSGTTSAEPMSAPAAYHT